ncbi:ABC transporter ATP-binding protein [Nocardiopsis alba]|uniref:ABC transporter ATP-binding protein n=1 Tax=Nocardiopsis alba TaxID=53437 RepID=UPI0033BE73EB
MLEIEQVGKTYPKTLAPALDDVSLTFGPGEVVAVIGHNGAGKSTLFDMAANLTRPTSGRVHCSVPPHRVGWCPQRTVVDWSLTVRQNIALGLELRTGLGRRATREHIDGLCDLMGLTEYIDREAETLSGGELRRTQIARAIAGNPDLMILDEPTTGLDPDAITRIFTHIRERAQQGATALISTHETSRFAAYCTRVVALHQGRLIADQSAEDFLASTGVGDDLWEGYRVLVTSATPGA